MGDSNEAVIVCLFVFFWIRNRICPTGSTPEGGPMENSPTTQATRHPRALLLFWHVPYPPILMSCILHQVSTFPVLLFCTDILPSIWSAPSLSSCPTHIYIYCRCLRLLSFRQSPVHRNSKVVFLTYSIEDWPDPVHTLLTKLDILLAGCRDDLGKVLIEGVLDEILGDEQYTMEVLNICLLENGK